jgi:hypothetical protein
VSALAEGKAWISEHFKDRDSLLVPLEFPAPIADPGNPRQLPMPGSNPQTLAFISALGGGNATQQQSQYKQSKLQPGGGVPQWGAAAVNAGVGVGGGSTTVGDENEIDLDDEDEEDVERDRLIQPESKKPRLDGIAGAGKKDAGGGGGGGFSLKMALPPPKHS